MVNENNFDCVQMVKGNSISDGQFNSTSYEVKIRGAQRNEQTVGLTLPCLRDEHNIRLLCSEDLRLVGSLVRPTGTGAEGPGVPTLGYAAQQILP